MSEKADSPERTATVWLEMSRGVGGHGGPGWDLGECVWSPSDEQWGGYRVMNEPSVGNMIVHCFQGEICGWSRVARACRVVKNSPPNPGRWQGMSPYFRIDLADYRPFSAAVPLKSFKERFAKEIQQEIETDRPRRYPFVLVPVPGSSAKRVATAQGRIISRITPNLLRLVCTALGGESGLLLADAVCRRPVSLS